jgi:hypothetical protein
LFLLEFPYLGDIQQRIAPPAFVSLVVILRLAQFKEMPGSPCNNVISAPDVAVALSKGM